MMGRSVGHDNHNSLGLGPERESSGVVERVELIFRNIAAAAGVQRTDPADELTDIRGHLIAIIAITIRRCRDHVILEGHQPQPVVAIVRRQIVGEIDDVLLDRVDIRLHRFGDVEHEHDIDRASLSDATKVENLGLFAIFVNFDVLGLQISDGRAVLVGQAEIEFHGAIGIEMFKARITDRQMEGGLSTGGDGQQHPQDDEGANQGRCAMRQSPGHGTAGCPCRGRRGAADRSRNPLIL